MDCLISLKCLMLVTNGWSYPASPWVCNICLTTCARACIQVEMSRFVTWEITKLTVLDVSALFRNLGPGDWGRALK